MTQFDDAVRDWGRTLGMSDLEFGHEDVIELRMAASRELYLEKIGEDLLLYVVQPISYPNVALFCRALELCDPRRHPEMTINAGLRGSNRLAFFVRLSGDDLHSTKIDPVFRQLCEMHSSIGSIF